jgi:hypothetical protein
LERAAAVVNGGERVVLLAGAGALEARDALLAVAELLGSPIVKTLPGKGCVPDDHQLTTGGIGLVGTKPSEEAMEQADTLFMVGTDFPYTKHLPPPGQVRVVQVDLDPATVGNRIPTEVPMVGDAAASLEALLPLLQQKCDRSFLETAQAGMADWREKIAALEDPTRDPIQPQYLMRLIDRHAADDTILASDSGTIATWSARHFDVRGGREYYLSGNLATMAPGLPYTIAAQWAHPGREYSAFVGDGGFAMLMAETLTAIRHVPPASAQPGHPRRPARPARPPGRPLFLLPMRQRQGVASSRAAQDAGDPRSRRRRGRRHHRALRPPRRGGRMGADPTSGSWTATCGPSPCPTSTSPTGRCSRPKAAQNPALTIMALAARCADHLASANRAHT